MKLIFGTHEDQTGQFVAEWVGRRIAHVGDGASFGLYSAIGVVAADGFNLLGGVVYHNYVPAYRSIEISTAADTARWLTRPVIASIMAYPFSQLQVERVTAVTPKRSASARRFLVKFGFKREGAHPKAYGDFGDAISYGLLRKDWDASPWARGRLGGQENAHGPGRA